MNYNIPDGPLHDFGAEAAHARAEAIDRQVEEWSQHSGEIFAALIGLSGATHVLEERLADLYEHSDEWLGKEVRKLIDGALRARAEREIDA